MFVLQWISYGKDVIEFDLPDDCECFEIEPNRIKAASEPLLEVENALNAPIGVRLEDLIAPGKRVCIISDDISRPTPVWLILRSLLPRLEALGTRREDIFFVLALGSHRKMESREICEKLGEEVLSEYRVLQSSFTDPNSLILVGTTENGIGIEVYRDVMDSDVRIGIGNIAPHGTLGWSGGAKILFPGVTSERTVSRFHMKAAMLSNSYFGDADNPVRHDIEQWAETIGLHFIVNTVLLGGGEIYRVVAGHPVLAHRKGVSFGREVYFVKAPHRADIVLVDSHPSDGDFWQGTKGFYPSDILLRDGGTSLLVAPCYEGEGPHPIYARMIGDDNAEAVLEALCRDGKTENWDPLAVAVGAQLSRMRRRYHMSMYTNGLPDEVLARAKIRRVRDIGRELARLLNRYGEGARLAIVRCGAEVVPEISESP